MWPAPRSTSAPSGITFGVLQQIHVVRLLAKFRLDRLLLSPSVGENPQFLPFFGLRHLVLSPFGNSRRRLNTGAQLQTFPYPTASKSFLYSNAFMAKSGAQFLTFKSVTDKQTDRQTNRQKNSTFLAWRSPSSMPNFTPVGATCRPCGAKNLKIGL